LVTPAWSALVAFLLASMTAPIALAILRDRVMDVPNERSSHDMPVPRGGGITVLLGVAVGYAVLDSTSPELEVALVVAVFLGIVGLAEDTRGLSIQIRFAAQFILGVLVALFILSRGDLGPWQIAAGTFIGAIWLTGYTNAFNFMDGINGISGFQLIVVGGAWIAVGHLDQSSVLVGAGALTVGAAAGFLPWNFPHPRFFMGDVGSYFSGSWIAAVTIVALTSGVRTWPLLGAVAVYIADTSYTLVRRIAQGEELLRSHRSHVYQRLVSSGWSHAKTDWLFFLFSCGLTLAGFTASSGGLGQRLAAGFTGLALVAGYLALPELLARNRT
jgi:UDP-N-acetylmuramyl pentapeptide phosphotransferase/UDP-N-acetylglucosamine-1-phosphate transferase